MTTDTLLKHILNMKGSTQDNNFVSLIAALCVLGIIIIVFGVHFGRKFASYVRNKLFDRSGSNILDDTDERVCDIETGVPSHIPRPNDPVETNADGTNVGQRIVRVAGRVLRALPRVILRVRDASRSRHASNNSSSVRYAPSNRSDSFITSSEPDIFEIPRPSILFESNDKEENTAPTHTSDTVTPVVAPITTNCSFPVSICNQIPASRDTAASRSRHASNNSRSVRYTPSNRSDSFITSSEPDIFEITRPSILFKSNDKEENMAPAHTSDTATPFVAPITTNCSIPVSICNQIPASRDTAASRFRHASNSSRRSVRYTPSNRSNSFITSSEPDIFETPGPSILFDSNNNEENMPSIHASETVDPIVAPITTNCSIPDPISPQIPSSETITPVTSTNIANHNLTVVTSDPIPASETVIPVTAQNTTNYSNLGATCSNFLDGWETFHSDYDSETFSGNNSFDNQSGFAHMTFFSPSGQVEELVDITYLDRCSWYEGPYESVSPFSNDPYDLTNTPQNYTKPSTSKNTEKSTNMANFFKKKAKYLQPKKEFLEAIKEESIEWERQYTKLPMKIEPVCETDQTRNDDAKKSYESQGKTVKRESCLAKQESVCKNRNSKVPIFSPSSGNLYVSTEEILKSTSLKYEKLASDENNTNAVIDSDNPAEDKGYQSPGENVELFNRNTVKDNTNVVNDSENLDENEDDNSSGDYVELFNWNAVKDNTNVVKDSENLDEDKDDNSSGDYVELFNPNADPSCEVVSEAEDIEPETSKMLSNKRTEHKEKEDIRKKTKPLQQLKKFFQRKKGKKNKDFKSDKRCNFDKDKGSKPVPNGGPKCSYPPSSISRPGPSFPPCPPRRYKATIEPASEAALKFLEEVVGKRLANATPEVLGETLQEKHQEVEREEEPKSEDKVKEHDCAALKRKPRILHPLKEPSWTTVEPEILNLDEVELCCEKDDGNQPKCNEGESLENLVADDSVKILNDSGGFVSNNEKELAVECHEIDDGSRAECVKGDSLLNLAENYSATNNAVECHLEDDGNQPLCNEDDSLVNSADNDFTKALHDSGEFVLNKEGELAVEGYQKDDGCQPECIEGDSLENSTRKAKALSNSGELVLNEEAVKGLENDDGNIPECNESDSSENSNDDDLYDNHDVYFIEGDSDDGLFLEELPVKNYSDDEEAEPLLSDTDENQVNKLP